MICTIQYRLNGGPQVHTEVEAPSSFDALEMLLAILPQTVGIQAMRVMVKPA